MGVAIVGLDILEMDVSAYDKHIMTLCSVMEGRSADEIAEWQSLDADQVRGAMKRWMDKGYIQAHEGSWRITPATIEIPD